MKKFLSSIFPIIFIVIPFAIWSQNSSPDFLRSTGKIYVVFLVVLAIFIGIILFLVRLDRKLTKIENQIKK